MKKNILHKEEAAALKKIWQEAKAKDKSLTQSKLAELCGYENPVVINQYLNGYIPLNLTALLKFSNVLKFNPNDVSPRLSKLINSDLAPATQTHIIKTTIDTISMQPDLLINDIVYIDPTSTPKAGDLVAVKTIDNQIIIRKLHKENTQYYLLTTNPAWPEHITLLTNHLSIIGKVIQRVTNYP